MLGEVGFVILSEENQRKYDNRKNYEAGYYYNKGKQDAKRSRKEHDTMTELEAKMEFLKRHSGSPEELELAKCVLGIK